MRPADFSACRDRRASPPGMRHVMRWPRWHYGWYLPECTETLELSLGSGGAFGFRITRCTFPGSIY